MAKARIGFDSKTMFFFLYCGPDLVFASVYHCRFLKIVIRYNTYVYRYSVQDFTYRTYFRVHEVFHFLFTVTGLYLYWLSFPD
jgi:hypothetical protein